MPLHQAYLSFNGGEITPYLAYLTNFDKHASSAGRMENFLPMPFGGFRKRPGTLHLTALDAATRLEAFTFSDGGSNLLAFQSTQVLIFDPDGTQVDSITAPFSDPFRLQFSQVNDIIYVTDPGHPPRQIVTDGSDWTIAEIPFAYPPLLDENLDEEFTIETDFETTGGSPPAWATFTNYVVGNRVTHGGDEYACIFSHASAAGTEPGVGVSWQSRWRLADSITGASLEGQEIDLIASQPIFTANHVGATFEISKKRAVDAFETELAATSANDLKASPPLVIQGKWNFNTFGTWKGIFYIQRSKDQGGTWENIRSFESDGDRNVATDGEEDVRCLLRIFWDYDATGTSKPRGVLSSAEAYIRGLVKITAVTDSTHATATALTPVEKTVTEFWKEGAFSAHQGFPRALAVHERRLTFAGTTLRPMGVWLSANDNLLDFKAGTAKGDPFFVDIAATRQAPILWLASQRRLFVGTNQGEWIFGSDTSDAAIAPDNCAVREYTRFGSNFVPALTINDSVYFIERQGLRLRELAFLQERETFDAANLTRLAEHITESGILQMAWQTSREPFLWSVTADGRLLAFAYHRQENIAAWSQHTTAGGSFRSVAVLRLNSDDDDVFFIIERDGEFHLEKFAASQQAVQEASDIDACHFVDSGVSGPTTGPDHELTVPAHLEGAFLNVLADGVSRTAYVLDGKITLPSAATHVHAGLPITSLLVSLPLEIQTERGPTHARRKRAHELKLNLYHSLGGAYTYDGTTKPIPYVNAIDAAPTLVTKWIADTLPTAHMDDLTYGITHTEPYPFLVRAAVLSWNIHEP